LDVDVNSAQNGIQNSTEFKKKTGKFENKRFYHFHRNIYTSLLE